MCDAKEEGLGWLLPEEVPKRSWPGPCGLQCHQDAARTAHGWSCLHWLSLTAGLSGGWCEGRMGDR